MSAGTLEKLPAWAGALVGDARVARLGLLDDAGAPRVLPVTFAVADGSLWSAVDDKPKRMPGRELARIRWLRARPTAALTADRYDEDWTWLAWVQLLGRVEILPAEDASSGLAALRQKYPPYRERPPAGPVLRLHPERGLWWRAADC